MAGQVAPPSGRTGLSLRIGLGAVGVALLGYGAVRIFTDAKDTKPFALAKWLVGSLLVHDLLIAPAVIGIGWVLGRVVPARARAYLQAALICGGLVSAVGVLMIWRQGKYGATSLALLQQNYRANLLLLLVIIALGAAIGYLIEVVRTKRTKTRSPADQ